MKINTSIYLYLLHRSVFISSCVPLWIGRQVPLAGMFGNIPLATNSVSVWFGSKCWRKTNFPALNCALLCRVTIELHMRWVSMGPILQSVTNTSNVCLCAGEESSCGYCFSFWRLSVNNWSVKGRNSVVAPASANTQRDQQQQHLMWFIFGNSLRINPLQHAQTPHDTRRLQYRHCSVYTRVDGVIGRLDGRGEICHRMKSMTGYTSGTTVDQN